MSRHSCTLAPAAMMLLAAVFTPATMAAQDFEGVISIRLSRNTPNGSNTSIDAQYFTKKGDVRIEVGAGTPNSIAGIILPGEKKIYRLISSQSLYMEQPLTEITPPGAATARVVRTMRKETIAGHECEHLDIITGADTVDACVAKGLGTFASASAALNAAGVRLDAWQRSLIADGAFPLRVSQRGAPFLEVTKVEKKFLSGTLFVVPDSYSRAPAPVKKPG